MAHCSAVEPPGRDPQVNVGLWLVRHAAARPDHPAVVVDGGPGEPRETLGYGELNDLANRTARALVELGVEPGDRVALALQSEPLYLALYFAAAKLGAILVPLNTRLTPSELGFQVADAEPRVVIHAPDVGIPAHPGVSRISVDGFRSALPVRAEEPLASDGGERPQVIMYTSGTTGEPKGAVLPHRKTLSTLSTPRSTSACARATSWWCRSRSSTPSA